MQDMNAARLNARLAAQHIAAAMAALDSSQPGIQQDLRLAAAALGDARGKIEFQWAQAAEAPCQRLNRAEVRRRHNNSWSEPPYQEGCGHE